MTAASSVLFMCVAITAALAVNHPHTAHESHPSTHDGTHDNSYVHYRTSLNGPFTQVVKPEETRTLPREAKGQLLETHNKAYTKTTKLTKRAVKHHAHSKHASKKAVDKHSHKALLEKKAAHKTVHHSAPPHHHHHHHHHHHQHHQHQNLPPPAVEDSVEDSLVSEKEEKGTEAASGHHHHKDKMLYSHLHLTYLSFALIILGVCAFGVLTGCLICCTRRKQDHGNQYSR